MDQSVCHSTLKFSFKTQEQATKFIKLFLKHHVNHVPADNLFYEVVTEFDEAVAFLSSDISLELKDLENTGV